MHEAVKKFSDLTDTEKLACQSPHVKNQELKTITSLIRVYQFFLLNQFQQIENGQMRSER